MKARTCTGNALNTGQSACPLDRDKVVGAIVVKHGQKLPADLTGTKLEELCHADRPARVMPISTFVEYAKNGGEVNVANVGYGPNEAGDVSAQTDAYTLDKYNDNLNSSLLKTMNGAFDTYFWDKKNIIYGMDDGTEILAGFPMSSIYPTDTPHPTSGAKATLLVNFCHKDARTAMENANYEQLDFNIADFAYGLVPVKWMSVGSNKYKIVEAVGGLDRTAEFADIIKTTPTAALKNTVTGVTWDAETETLTIPLESGETPQFKSPSALYEAGIKGIEQYS